MKTINSPNTRIDRTERYSEMEFALPKSSFVILTAYNLRGEQVVTLIAEQREAGVHRFNWEASRLSSGVYVCRLEVGDPSTSSGQHPSTGSASSPQASSPNKSGQAGQIFVRSKKLILMR